jgi:3'-5' exonuclease
VIKLFFDIETIPADESKKEIVTEIIKNKHLNRFPEGEEVSDEEFYRRSALDGTFGRVCCIAYVKEVHERGKTVTKGILQGEEEEIIQKFWELARGVNLFIGHNILGFDLPFMYKRSVIHGIKPSVDISLSRYKSYPVYDTMFEWEKWGGTVALDTLAKMLDLPTSKDEMDGSQVWDFYRNGQIDKICEYCMKDTELTRKVYYRLNYEKLLD